MDREIGVFGDPGYCVERIRALREEYGFDGVHRLLQPGRAYGSGTGQGDDEALRRSRHAAFAVAQSVGT
jgi:hypothetical protein